MDSMVARKSDTLCASLTLGGDPLGDVDRSADHPFDRPLGTTPRAAVRQRPTVFSLLEQIAKHAALATERRPMVGDGRVVVALGVHELADAQPEQPRLVEDLALGHPPHHIGDLSG